MICGFTATAFCEISRHVRVDPCSSVAMMKNMFSVSSHQPSDALHSSQVCWQSGFIVLLLSLIHILLVQVLVPLLGVTWIK